MCFIRNLLILLALAAMISCAGKKDKDTEVAPMKLANQMAQSDMKRNPEGWMIDFRDKPKWEYTHGLMMNAYLELYEETHKEGYLEYVGTFADTMVQGSGDIITYKLSDYNIDRVSPGRFLIDLYNINPKEKYRKAIELLRSQMLDHPRTSEGGFWHKKRYPHQMWLDGLYMGSPFLTLYGREFGESQLFDDVVHQIMLVNKHHYDEEAGLFYHGWDESGEQKWADNVTGLSDHFWGRAIGWFAMATVDVLEYLPEDHPGRDSVLFVVGRIADGIIKFQDQESGVWYQVVDQWDREGNYLESSASSMFAYFLYSSLNEGYLDASKYQAAADKAYKGIVKEFIREEENGTISITNVCAVAGLGGDPYRDGTYEYYISEPVRANDPKAVGPFIMASIEKSNYDKNQKDQ